MKEENLRKRYLTLSIPKLKKLADKEFSLWLRNNYAKEGKVKCYTCDKEFDIKSIQCGHYISRIYTNLRWAEINCRPQCYSCNIMLRGNFTEFGIRLEREKQGALEELHKWKVMPSTQLKRQDLIDIIFKYRN